MTESVAARTELDLDTGTGRWAVRSSGPTVYLLDLDVRPARCLRAPGPTSPRGLTDDAWADVVDMQAVAMDATATPGKIRMGCRTLWFLDPGPDHPDVIWWLQREVTAITPLPAGEGNIVGPA